LERHGIVSSKDGCQSILVSLAKDICNQKEYRTTRQKEIFKLRKIIKNLQVFIFPAFYSAKSKVEIKLNELQMKVFN